MQILEGKLRENVTKSNAKMLRKNGYILANIYGKGADNVHCAFLENDFLRAIKAKKTLIFSVKIGEKNYDVAVKEYQKDVVTGKILHVDLLLAQSTKSRYKIPVRAVGTPVGLKNKGVLLISKKYLNVLGEGKNLPNFFEIDTTSLDVGHSVLVRDIRQDTSFQILDKPSVAVLGVIKAK